MEKQITVTASTNDYETLKEVGELFKRLAAAGVTADTVAERTDLPSETFRTALVAATPPPAAAAAAAVEPPPAAAVEPEELGVGDYRQPPVAEFAPSAPAVAVDTETDSEGIPWDKRIHSSAKTRRQGDNTWKLIRGVSDALVRQVKAELTGLMATPVPPAAAAVPPAAVPPAAVPPAAVPPAAVPPAAAAGVPITFPGLLQAFTFKQGRGEITADEMNAICVGQGVASLPLLASRSDLIPAVFAAMEALCLTRG